MADTKRLLNSIVEVHVDTKRDTIAVVSISSDTVRQVKAPVTVSADTKRTCKKFLVFTTDTRRDKVQVVSIPADTWRTTTQISETVTIIVDTKRTKTGAVTVPVDTKRKRKGDLSDIISLTISLQNQTLADTYQIDTMNDSALGKIYSGTLFGWPWECALNSKVFNPSTKRFTIRGDYDISSILKAYIAFDRFTRTSPSALQHIAGQLGKTLVNLTDAHGIRRLSEQSTVIQVLSGLFGWTSSAPNIMVNVFLRGDTLYAVQRGKEQGTYTPIKYNILNVSEQKLDTLMDVGRWDPQIIGDPTGEYTNGIYSFNGCSIEYINGYVVRTVDASGEVKTFTWGSDDPNDPDVQRYLIASTQCPAGEMYPFYTSYYYRWWKGSLYLATEITRQTKKFSYIIPVYPYVGSMTAPTYYKGIDHAPAGNGFYSSKGVEKTWKYGYLVDKTQNVVAGFGLTEHSEKVLPSQISEGRPGGAVTPREQSAEDSTPTLNVPYIPFAPSHIPVTSVGTLLRYYEALQALDGATEYKMTIDCYDEHILDYTETITIDGKVWYLDGNSIVLSGSSPYKKQTVNLVRWAK